MPQQGGNQGGGIDMSQEQWQMFHQRLDHIESWLSDHMEDYTAFNKQHAGGKPQMSGHRPSQAGNKR